MPNSRRASTLETMRRPTDLGRRSTVLAGPRGNAYPLMYVGALSLPS